jgi:hypothetical protein
VTRTDRTRAAAWVTGVLACAVAGPPGGVRGADAAAAAATRPAAAPAASSPATRAAQSTYHEWHARRLAFNRRTLVDAYNAVGRRDPRWDADAVAFLGEMAEQFAGASLPAFYKPADRFNHRTAIPAAAALAAAGCDDPLVLYCYGAMLMDEGKLAEARPLLKAAEPGLRRAKYPAYRVAAAADRLAKLAGQTPEAAALAARARADFVDACCGPDAAADRQVLLDTVWKRMDQDRPAQQAFADALAARPDADPWVRRVVAGRLHTKLAWDSRGGGWANTVTPEGWKGFFEHLRAARAALTTAWEIDPTLPEAPTDMIPVAMGGGGDLNEQPLDWFERALKAQVDYDPAYQAMLGGPLLPRWGGSYEAMLQLGDACLAVGRYDTTVPWQYVLAVWRIGEDAKRPWAPLSDPAVYAKVVQVADGYAKAGTGERGEYYQTVHAAAAWRAGRWAEARAELDRLSAAGRTPDTAAFRFFGAELGREEIASVYARTGPRADDVAAAEAAAEADPAAALAKFNAALAGLGADDPAVPYLAGRAGRLDAKLKFAAGDWAPLTVDGTLAGWKQDQGKWTAAFDGTLTAVLPRPGWTRLRWAGRPDRELGSAFEVAATVPFPPAGGRGEHSVGVFAFNPQARDGLTFYVGVKGDRGEAYFSLTGRPQKHAKVDVPAVAHLRVRFQDRAVTLFVEDKQVGEPYRLPDDWPADVGFCVGGYAGAPIKFRELKVRRIVPGDAADKPAAGPEAK